MMNLHLSTDHLDTRGYHLPANPTDSGWVRSLIGRFLAQLALMERIRIERAQLAGLTDEMLGDIGISRSAVTHESERGFFDIPTDRK